MNQREGGKPSIEHAEVYHAAPRCQAASLSLTPRRLHDQKMACSIERQKRDAFASQEQAGSGCPGNVETFCPLEDRSLIGFLLLPHGKNNAHPHVCQGSYSHTMAFSLLAFALVISSRPRLLSSRLPGKLLKGIAQRFDTGVALMHLGVVATLIRSGRGPGQGLEAGCIAITLPIISPLSQQPGSQAFARSWKTFKNRAVSMGQKKVCDHLVVGSDLLNQRQQLSDQSQHQTRFGARGNTISLQLWLVQHRNNLWGNDLRCGMTSLLEHLCDLLVRSFQSLRESGIGLQKDQRRALLQLAKQLQGDRIVRLQTGGELIDQAGLALDQAVLITAEGGSSFGDLRTIGFKSPQVSEIRSTCFWKPSRHRSNQSWLPMQLSDDRRSWD
jgi:hypothetical protein